MSLDCDYEEMYDRPKRDVVSYILQVGEARQMLKDLTNHDDLNDLRKHNEYWDSEYPKEADKLDDARCRLKFFQEKLFEVLEKLE